MEKKVALNSLSKQYLDENYCLSSNQEDPRWFTFTKVTTSGQTSILRVCSSVAKGTTCGYSNFRLQRIKNHVSRCPIENSFEDATGLTALFDQLSVKGLVSKI